MRMTCSDGKSMWQRMTEQLAMLAGISGTHPSELWGRGCVPETRKSVLCEYLFDCLVSFIKPWVMH